MRDLGLTPQATLRLGAGERGLTRGAPARAPFVGFARSGARATAARSCAEGLQ